MDPKNDPNEMTRKKSLYQLSPQYDNSNNISHLKKIQSKSFDRKLMQLHSPQHRGAQLICK
jgi:hypothetical protein